MANLSGWGRFPRCDGALVLPRTPRDAAEAVKAGGTWIARGNGRSYGDAAASTGLTLSTLGLDRLIAFDDESGLLDVEAGVLLSDIIATLGPRGFFPPVVPGTRLVTVGGMIAADVHGKNHHRAGCISRHVESFDLLLPSGEVLSCSRGCNPELFWATVGGMGLTGMILRARLRLGRVETGWLTQRTETAATLGETLAALDRAGTATFCVAWIDCAARGPKLGRSIVLSAEHASLKTIEARGIGDRFPCLEGSAPAWPLDLPEALMRRGTARMLNELHFRRHAGKHDRGRLIDWNSCFFPLDALRDWNRLYGRRGFIQHQCVVPAHDAERTLGSIIGAFAKASGGLFLSVLKRFGPGGEGWLSFPIDGYTLAVDTPVRADVFAVLDSVDAIVAAAGGRNYLAKDSTQSADTLAAGYGRLGDFRALRKEIGAAGRLRSRLSDRLGL